MKSSTTLALVAAAAAAALAAGGAAAQATWPAKAIRFIVPWPTGGGADTMTRLLQPRLAEALGQQVIVDNRGGAAGNIGAEIASKSPPDGYTIVFVYSGTHAINPSLYSRMPFKESDFTPVIWLSDVPQVLVVHPTLPVKTARDVANLARSRPGQLTFASSGAGAINHLAGELFKMVTGTNMVHIPYKGGGPAGIALIGGEVAMIFAEPATVVAHFKSGKLKAIATTGPKRALGMPDLPTFAESGVPGFEVTSWNGVHAPAGVPPEIIRRLNTELNRIIALPEMKERLLTYGFEAVGGPPEKFGEHIRAETVKWAKVVRQSGARVD